MTLRHFTLITFTALVTLAASSCSQTDDEHAKPLLEKIEQLYTEGKYKQTLDSITLLRDRFPAAVEARRKALEVWQNASLKMAQAEVASTDILLQQTIDSLNNATDRYTRNMLGVKRDSLKARYEAMCGVVRMIRMKQKESK